MFYRGARGHWLSHSAAFVSTTAVGLMGPHLLSNGNSLLSMSSQTFILNVESPHDWRLQLFKSSNVLATEQQQQLSQKPPPTHVPLNSAPSNLHNLHSYTLRA
jgi:hypothetical protein